MKVLPLEYLDVIGQVKCILSIIVTAVVMPVNEDKSHQIVLNDALLVLKCMLFDGRGIHALMNFFGPGSVLQWFISLLLKTMSQVNQFAIYSLFSKFNYIGLFH
jgi:hypothetical protein